MTFRKKKFEKKLYHVNQQQKYNKLFYDRALDRGQFQFAAVTVLSAPYAVNLFILFLDGHTKVGEDGIFLYKERGD